MDEQKVETKPEDTAIATQTQAVPEQKQAEIPEETPQQIDWKRFKEARKKEREAKEAAEREAAAERNRADAMKAALEALVNKPQATQEEHEETDEERINRLVDARLAAERTKDAQSRAEREARELPSKLAQTYNDFDQVCSTENLDYLEYHYPEVARAFTTQPDNFQKWSDIYKAVKRFVPNNTNSKKEANKAEKNLTKPQALSSQGMSQTGDHPPSHKLDEKRKADNWERMRRRIKGLA